MDNNTILARKSKGKWIVEGCQEYFTTNSDWGIIDGELEKPHHKDLHKSHDAIGGVVS